MEHRENVKISHPMCHQGPLDATSDVHVFLKIMVVVVFGSSLKYLCKRKRKKFEVYFVLLQKHRRDQPNR